MDNILFVDIETCPEFPAFEDMPVAGQSAFYKKFKYLLEKEPQTYQNMNQIYKEKASFCAEFSQIVCIGVGRVTLSPQSPSTGSDYLKVHSFTGPEGTELEILSKFSGMCAPERGVQYICAHNGNNFDFPVLGRRMMIHGLTIPYVLDNRSKKTWEFATLDTMSMWAFGEWRYSSSLETLAYVFGIPNPKATISGADVHKLFLEGKTDEIGSYCKEDVVTLVQVFRRLTNRPLLSPDQIQRV